MITLITGLPGNGKTLYALAMVKDLAAKEDRPVFYSGIADIKLPWIEHDATRWMELAPRSIMVIDEVQRVMRPRMHGTTVPDFVAALETHRHKGLDLVLITQHPSLVDANVRRLVGRHLHVVRKFGTQFATIHEWGSVKDNCDKNRSDSIRHEWRYPKEAFGWYKSAEAHTVKRRIPFKVWALLAVPVVVIGGFWVGLTSYGSSKPKPANTSSSGVVATAPAAGQPARLTPAQYVDQFQPRVAGLAYTAPAYDEVTKPVRAPYPAACVRSEARCGCYSQQGTRLDVPKAMCEAIVGGGFFIPWDEREPPEARHAAAERLQASEVFRAEVAPGLINLGGPAAEVARLRNQKGP